MPTSAYGVRNLLELAATSIGRSLTPTIETESFDLIRHYVTQENAVGFQIPIGLKSPHDADFGHRPLAERDVRPGQLLLGQLKGRALPVASAKFGQQLVAALEALSAQ